MNMLHGAAASGEQAKVNIGGSKHMQSLLSGRLLEWDFKSPSNWRERDTVTGVVELRFVFHAHCTHTHG